MSKFKAGDRVVCVNNSEGYEKSFIIGNIYVVTTGYYGEGYINAQGEDGVGHTAFAHRFELAKEEKKVENVKTLLKNFMRVKLRNGMLYIYAECGAFGNGGSEGMLFTEGSVLTYSVADNYSDEGICCTNAHPEWDIMAIYMPKVDCSKVTKPDVYGKLVWERKERETIELNGKKYYKDELAEALSKIKPIN